MTDDDAEVQAVLEGLSGAKPCPLCRHGMRHCHLRFDYDNPVKSVVLDQNGWHCWECAWFELETGKPVIDLLRDRLIGMWAWKDDD